MVKVYADLIEFQSTLPRGERPAPASVMTFADVNFNPRSREGSDTNNISSFYTGSNFNPRSREGSDIDEMMEHKVKDIFQSTLPRGERLY